ncbi:MAG: hypothetical protein II759_03805 [Lachnospiraceae bacterium]|nr:hypothetical protein [Lachnospiraceae bacterium]
MYLSPKKHILSGALIACALIRLGGSFIAAAIRLVLRKGGSALPDMLIEQSEAARSAISAVQVLLSAAVFFLALRRIKHMIDLIPEEDRADLGRLQEEAFGRKVSALSAETIAKLLEIWMAILVGAQILYDISVLIYRNIVVQFLAVTASVGSGAAGSMTAIYNSTHGFKYLSMVIAIMLGIMVTGIFLSDRALELSAAVISAAFIAAFALLRMASVNILNTQIGIVWTSVIFHFVETAGLLLLALYLRERYNGV